MKIHLDRVFETIRTLMVQKRDYFAAAAFETLENYAFEMPTEAEQPKASNTHTGR